MQKILSISFALLYILAMFRPVQPVLNYYLNQDYIAKFLCINKDKPALHCNGKCYLMKQLEKQSKEKNAPAPNIQLENYPIGFVYIFRLKENHTNFQFGFQASNSYTNHYFFLYQPSTFHPPKFERTSRFSTKMFSV